MGPERISSEACWWCRTVWPLTLKILSPRNSMTKPSDATPNSNPHPHKYTPSPSSPSMSAGAFLCTCFTKSPRSLLPSLTPIPCPGRFKSFTSLTTQEKQARVVYSRHPTLPLMSSPPTIPLSPTHSPLSPTHPPIQPHTPHSAPHTLPLSPPHSPPIPTPSHSAPTLPLSPHTLPFSPQTLPLSPHPPSSLPPTPQLSTFLVHWWPLESRSPPHPAVPCEQ